MTAPPDGALKNCLAQTLSVGTTGKIGQRLTQRFSRRVVLSTLIGSSIGFAFGIAARSLWQLIADMYRRRSETNDIDEVMHELVALKSELSEMRTLLHSRPVRRSHSGDVHLPFYMSDDDEFFDINSDDSNPDAVAQAGLEGMYHSSPGSFLSANSQLSSTASRPRLGPPVPIEVTDELDQLAAIALGDCAMVSSTPKLLSSGDERGYGAQAYAKCLVYKTKYRRSPDFLWRYARAHYLASVEAAVDEDASTEFNDADFASEVASISSGNFDARSLNDLAYEEASRKQFIQTGLVMARRALFLARVAQNQPGLALTDVSLAEVYKWLAVLVGLASDFGGMQQRISYGHEFKELTDKAIEFNPNDAYTHYLRGRWSYQVYNLTWVERQFASRLFAAPPTATLEEAILDFNETERLRPNFYAASHLYLGKCYIGEGDYKNAGIWLTKARILADQQRLPPPDLDSPTVGEEIATLIAKYASYF